MEINAYADSLNRELSAALSSGGPETERAGRLLSQVLDSAARIGALELLADAADEVTAALAEAGQSIEVQLRLSRGETRLVVSPLPVDETEVEQRDTGEAETIAVLEAGDGDTARVTLRMPELLKTHVERAAAGEGISANAWIVRAITHWNRGPAVGPTPVKRQPDRGNRIQGYTTG